jgi:uncharacterized protein
MLQNIFAIFGRSPISLLQQHMERVARCVQQLKPLFEAFEKENFQEVEKLALLISDLEHSADIKKNEIKNRLPGSLLFAIDRSTYIDILLSQDSIADAVEDVAVVMTLRPLKYRKAFHEPLTQFLNKNIEAFESVFRVHQELPNLVESSFQGIEAEKVRLMIDDVAKKEHEADLIQKDLLRALLNEEEHLTAGTFFQWQKMFEVLGRISDACEILGANIRVTLEVSS